ncbi:MAG: potassium transporter Kup [Mangrovicoccus sp.]|nr:potassium transporter Kup [Mangrovicoccus sp.]
MREALHKPAQDGLIQSEVVGVVSLLIWTLVLIVTFKYVILILRADNHGEGGTLSLMALAQGAIGKRTRLLFLLGVLGAALFYGDAAITPAISVLSAVEGLELVTPAFEGVVVPVTIVILVALFWFQSNGTDRVSIFFGPVTLVWFVTLTVLGAMHIGDSLWVLHAFNPWMTVQFLASHGFGALPTMGAVFLAVTGAEALYADMGHFGKRPIRFAWSAVVFPALAINYLGQGALVLAHPETVENPFFLMAPGWFLLPLVILATAATVIASQAVISGAFSLTHQAVQLGLLPRLEIRHTSESLMGQIYLPRVNWTLLAAVLILVLFFKTSSSLASAYGIAVTGTMLVTTMLAAVVFRRAWGWSPTVVALILLPLLLIELIFFFANVLKIFDGGYAPLLLAALVGLLMWTWVRGSAIVKEKTHRMSIALSSLLPMLAKSSPAQAPGTAVFLTSDPDVAPAALMHNLKHNAVLHKQNLIVTVYSSTQPRLTDDQRLQIEPLADGFYRVILTFGYMETPNVPKALALARKSGVKFDIMSTSFFLNRRSFKPSSDSGMPLWQDKLFIGMTKAATDATSFYRLPSNRVLELGQQFVI